MTLQFAQLDFNAQQTPISTQFDDIYFSTQDGLAESYYVFQEGNQLWQKWQQHDSEHFVIAETGFGTGLNFLAVAERFQQFLKAFPTATLKRLFFISFEKFPLTSEQLTEIHRVYPQFATFSTQLTACWQPNLTGCQRYHFEQISLDVWFGDLHDNLPQLGDSYIASVDCWFLDGFSPDKNPEMWSESLYQQMFRLTKPQGSFATFTAASAVRKGLQAVGFDVQKRKGFGKKREMLWGEKPAQAENSAIQYPYFYAKPADIVDDIAIVGGGVASFFLAWSLLERGKKVTLYCQDAEVAQNASGNLQGAIYPQFSDDDFRNVRFYLHSFDYALQRLKQVAQKVEFEYNFCGVALYAYNEKTEQKLQKITSQWQANLIEWLNAEQLSHKVGLPVAKGGAFIPQGGWISPMQLVKNGIAYLQTQGLEVVLNHRVSEPYWQGNRWQWRLGDKTFSHQALVLANGHQLLDFSMTKGVPLYPVRGQVSHIPTTPTLSQLQAVLCYDGYLTPTSAQGLHCLGASHFRDDANNDWREKEHQENGVKLCQNLTACNWLNNVDLSQNQGKVGVRAAFRDRVPMVGAVGNFEQQAEQYVNLYNQLRRREKVPLAANFPNLYTIAGLGSRGLSTAPLLAELLASQICQEPVPLSEDILHTLSPSRTWLRKLLKGSKVEF